MSTIVNKINKFPTMENGVRVKSPFICNKTNISKANFIVSLFIKLGD